jgi:hypothetical protein
MTGRTRRPSRTKGTFGATLFYRTTMFALVAIPFLLFAMAAR